MPIPLPNLDDRTYTDLIERAKAQIPRLYPEWTDHNATDPGITLIEMYTWLVEMQLYRVDQIPEENYRIFLKLLNGGESDELSTGDLETDIRQSILALRTRYRAATIDDYEKLVLEDWHLSDACKKLGDEGIVQRARCVAERNLELNDPKERNKSVPGHVSLVVVPAPSNGSSNIEIKPSDDLLQELWRYFEERRLLTTRHHVVAPDYVKISVAATLYLDDDASADTVHERAIANLSKFFHPLTGGPECLGWPFGRDVHLSEIYALLDEAPGVDFVRDAQIGDTGTEFTSIKLKEYELVALDIANIKFTFMERLGKTWKKIS